MPEERRKNVKWYVPGGKCTLFKRREASLLFFVNTFLPRAIKEVKYSLNPDVRDHRRGAPCFQ